MSNQTSKSENKLCFVSPNDNFYLSVNQKWLNDPANKIPADYSRWGGFIKLHDVGLSNQIELVKDIQNKVLKSEEENKISIIWEASCKRFKNWTDKKSDYDPISRELEILDAFFSTHTPIADDIDLTTRLAEYFHYSLINSITNVFDFDKGSDLKNSNNVVLNISTSGLSLPGREYYTDSNFTDKRETFKQHLTNVFNIVNTNSTIQLDENFVNNILEFENQLARYTMKRDQSRKYNEYYTNTTLTDLYQKIDDLVSLPEKVNNYTDEENNFKLSDNRKVLIKIFLEKTYELFDFRVILKNNLKKFFVNKNIINPPKIDQIVAYDGDAIRRTFDLILNKNNFIKYKSFLQYKIICSLKGFCTKDLDEEFFDFYNRKLNGQLEQKSEEKRSIQTVNMYAEEMLGKVFVENYFPEACKRNIKRSIHEILDVMKDSIKKNDWLTNITKSKALEKLSKFNVKIGYPDVWKDYSKFNIVEGDNLYNISKKYTQWKLQIDFYDKLNSVLDRDEWLMSPQTVNAYFMPTQNEIVFPAAILQPPFYCKSNNDIDFDIKNEQAILNDFDFTPAVNFGGIGAVIAHEITHGYDDKGRKFDGDGNLNEWWTEQDETLFKAKEEIMSQQVEKYSFIDTEDSNKEYKLNAKLTMGENLADLGGISLALQALNKYLIDNNMTEEIIRINQRVFFKSFANIWKQNTKKDFFIYQLTLDPHSPADFRANLVKNMDEFYKVFNITESDNMYIHPDKRVRMW